MLEHILKEMRLADGVALMPSREREAQPVFIELTRDVLEAARKRMAKTQKPKHDLYAALKAISEHVEPWSWQTLRRTAASAFANMQNVGPWQESQLLGHGVAVAEARYARRMKGPPDARTIEAALAITQELVAVAKAIYARDAK